MKNLFLFAIITLLSVSTIKAQDSKTIGGFDNKDLYITGSLGFNSVSVSGVDADVSAFTFSPSVGYFVSENLALELGLTVGTSETENIGSIVESNSYGANLSGIYFFTPKNSFSFLVGGTFSYLNQSIEVDGNDAPSTNSFGLGIAPGINYFVSNSIALRATVGALSYTTSKQDVDGAPSINSFGFNLNLSNVNFGITYKF